MADMEPQHALAAEPAVVHFGGYQLGSVLTQSGVINISGFWLVLLLRHISMCC